MKLNLLVRAATGQQVEIHFKTPDLSIYVLVIESFIVGNIAYNTSFSFILNPT